MSKAADVRSRRAYFDCRFGQLHVRTAFPGTGGFDEFTTLFCIHPNNHSSRLFDPLLAHLAKDRSVYAADRPGYGESDAVLADAVLADADGVDALALADLAADLRLRSIDLLGVEEGGSIAFEFARAKPEWVRRIVVVGRSSNDSGLSPAQPTLFVPADTADAVLPPEVLAKAVMQFLNKR